MKMLSTLVVALMTLASMAGVASEKLDMIGEIDGCHLLMTQKECAVHTRALARLPLGAERDAFLLAHRQLMREREKACSCVHDANADFHMTSGYQPGKQALLRF